MDIGALVRGAIQPWGAESEADLPALSIEDGETFTYRELNERINCYANALLGLGVDRRDRVGLLLYNSLEYVALYFAAARIGAISVRLNWRLAAEELAYAITDSGCKVILLEGALVSTVEAIRGDLPTELYVAVNAPPGDLPSWMIRHDALLTGSTAEPAVPLPAADDVAMIMYTSGTTGRPKGAVWTHGNAVAFALMQQAHWALGPETVALTSGPLFHVGSFEDLILPTLLAKGRAVLVRSRNFEIGRLLEVCSSLAATDALLQPTMIYEILRLPTVPTAQLSSLRRIMTGGANLQRWALDRIAEHLPTIELVTLYGLTEGGAISTGMSLLEPGADRDSVGVPLAPTEIKVVLDDGSEASEGVDGEVLVRSPSSSSEYWNQPEASAATFVDGWCRTGDQGRVNGGLLYITGRKKDMIKSGGENIYPIEVENVLLEHPAIGEAAVIGVPDERFIETVCAVVVPTAGRIIDEGDVIEFCRKRLAGYKKPRHIVIVEELPRTPTGKIRKPELRERYATLGDLASSSSLPRPV